MQEVRYVNINKQRIPVLISDEHEALLAAKAAGRAIVGLWRPGGEEDWSPAEFLVEEPEDADERFLERVVRRRLGLPWFICGTERLKIREIFGDDYEEIWGNQVGHGFGSVEELEAYTRNQYRFYEFGFWAVVERESGELAGIAGLTVCREEEDGLETYWLGPDGAPLGAGSGAEAGKASEGGISGAEAGQASEVGIFSAEEPGQSQVLELGYHIFRPYRRKGYGREACQAILAYGREELGVFRYVARIRKENTASRRLAESLGFQRRTSGSDGENGKI